MKLTFLGTRGNIRARSRRHRRHTSLRVSYRGESVLIDCGEDWRGRLRALEPKAIVVTHAHPDHVGALRDGAPCPVWATGAAWDEMSGWDLPSRHRVEPRQPFELRGIGFEAFSVEHSLRAPAVGYRIQAGRAAIFYAPDVVAIRDQTEALVEVAAYVGDGARIDRDLVRDRDGRPIGHASVRTQLDWCAEEGVSRAIFTHCGTRIVEGDERRLGPLVRRLGRERDVEAEIAHDGMEVTVR